MSAQQASQNTSGGRLRLMRLDMVKRSHDNRLFVLCCRWRIKMSLCRRYDSWWLRLRCMARRFEWRALISSTPKKSAEPLPRNAASKNDGVSSMMINPVDISEFDRG